MKVSVIIPVYNVGPYIEEAVRSVTDQTLSDLQIIVVDDRGTDDSMERVSRLASEDTRISIISNPENLGLASSRNAGLSRAEGEYVYFLDGDDKIVPDALQKLYDLAVRDDLEAVLFEADFIYENEELQKKFSSNPAMFKGDYEGVKSGRDLYVRMMDNWDWMPSQPRWFYRRSFLIGNGLQYTDGMLHEDEIFTFDVMMSVKRMEILKEQLFIRRFRASSIMTGTVTKASVDGCIRILQRVRGEQKKISDPALSKAMDFYCGKITADTRGKISRIEGYEPSVSVVIPVYNVEPWLGECLDSLLMQTFRDFEIIAVDDGSTDGSAKVLHEAEALEPRLKIFRMERNCGQAAARNKGLDQSAGRYVYFLDADDLIIPEALEELVAEADRSGADVVAFGHLQFTDDPEFADTASGVLFSYEGMEGTGSGEEIFSRLVTGENISPSVPTYLIRRDFINRTGLRFIEGILHEDIGYIYEMLRRSQKTSLVAKAYFLRRIRLGSTVTSVPGRARFEGYIRSLERSFELDGLSSDPAVLKWRRDVFGRIRQLYLEAGNSASGDHSLGANESTKRIFDILKMISPSAVDAEMILGSDLYGQLREEKEIFICSDGQYANLMIDLATSLDLVIRGAIVLEKKRNSLRGIRILTPDEISEEQKDIPVVLTVSHFTRDRYRAALTKTGFTKIRELGEGY